MTPTQFWFGDLKLLNRYQTAYMRNKSYEAWLHGYYVFEAMSKAIYNSFGRKQGDEPQQYGKWVEPFERIKQANETLEEKFRREQYEQNAWLFAK